MHVTPHIRQTQFLQPISSPKYYAVITDKIVSEHTANNHDKSLEKPPSKSMTPAF